MKNGSFHKEIQTCCHRMGENIKKSWSDESIYIQQSSLIKSGHLWLTSIISATWEAENNRIMVWDQPS
jgi:hypothetical protein